jgi:hypothetical protein
MNYETCQVSVAVLLMIQFLLDTRQCHCVSIYRPSENTCCSRVQEEEKVWALVNHLPSGTSPLPFPTKCLISQWPRPRFCVSCLAGRKTEPEGKQDQTTAFRPLSDDVVERKVKTTDDHLRRSFRQCRKFGTSSSASSCWPTLLQPLSL